MRNTLSKSVINILLRLMKETSRWRGLINSSMGVEGPIAGMTYLAPLVRRRKHHIELASEKHSSNLGFFYFFTAKEGKFFFIVELVFHFLYVCGCETLQQPGNSFLKF